jgi:hypothetical protein
LHRGCQVGARLHLDLEQVSGDLGVGLREEHVAGSLQLGAQRREVLQDAVVHHGHPARLAEVRVGVGVVGCAVSGPAGVTDAGRGCRERSLADRLLQVGQLSGALVGGDRARTVGGVDQRDSGGVVAAIFEATQPIDHDVLRLLLTDISHNSAHAPESTQPTPDLLTGSRCNNP